MTTQLYRTGESAVTVRDPDEAPRFARNLIRVGGTWRTLDGSGKQHVTAAKWRWEVSWTMLTDAQYTTISTELQRLVPMSWSPPDEATTYSVMIVGDPELWDDGIAKGIRCTLEEV